MIRCDFKQPIIEKRRDYPSQKMIQTVHEYVCLLEKGHKGSHHLIHDSTKENSKDA